MIEERLVSLLREAAAAASPALGDAPPPETIELTRPPNREFGDFSTNLALVWASQLGARPKEVAQAIVDNLPDDPLPDRAAHHRARAERGHRRHAGPDARIHRVVGGARVLLQRRRGADGPLRRVGRGAVPRADRPRRGGC